MATFKQEYTVEIEVILILTFWKNSHIPTELQQLPVTNNLNEQTGIVHSRDGFVEWMNKDLPNHRNSNNSQLQ